MIDILRTKQVQNDAFRQIAKGYPADFIAFSRMACIWHIEVRQD